MTCKYAIMSIVVLAAVVMPASMLADTAVEGADATPRHADDVMADTLSLGEVQVTAKRTKDVIPVQVLSGAELERLNSQTVADALRYFSGVQVKDYGGVGGIKTVNVRSMGTNHTGVVYDGVELGNAQNGQIDLGQFSLDNVEAISLYNGQKSEILQPARDFGTAATVYMRTRTPRFAEGETYHARFNMRFGSFDLINPSALIEIRLARTVSASLSAEWLNSSGKYKFRYRRVTPAGSWLTILPLCVRTVTSTPHVSSSTSTVISTWASGTLRHITITPSAAYLGRLSTMYGGVASAYGTRTHSCRAVSRR